MLHGRPWNLGRNINLDFLQDFWILYCIFYFHAGNDSSLAHEGRKNIVKLCFFCGAKEGNNPKHMLLVVEMMNSFPQGTEVIYGGAQIGIMGKVADAAIKNNLSVTGIMP